MAINFGEILHSTAADKILVHATQVWDPSWASNTGDMQSVINASLTEKITTVSGNSYNKSWIDSSYNTLLNNDVQSNWSQNTTSSLDYIKGRTHYIAPGTTTTDTFTISVTSGTTRTVTTTLTTYILDNIIYTSDSFNKHIVINNVTYDLIINTDSSAIIFTIGNTDYLQLSLGKNLNGESTYDNCDILGTGGSYSSEFSEEFTNVVIKYDTSVYHKLDNSYINTIDSITEGSLLPVTSNAVYKYVKTNNYITRPQLDASLAVIDTSIYDMVNGINTVWKALYFNADTYKNDPSVSEFLTLAGLTDDNIDLLALLQKVIGILYSHGLLNEL